MTGASEWEVGRGPEKRRPTLKKRGRGTAEKEKSKSMNGTCRVRPTALLTSLYLDII